MTSSFIHRPVLSELTTRLNENSSFIQVIMGPRQVGKTTAAEQIQEKWRGPSHYAAADLPLPPGPEWIETQWAIAKKLSVEGQDRCLLILDEVQKISRWSEVLKAFWDSQKKSRSAKVSVLILGSSSLLLQEGLSESLAGRFELSRFTHWTFSECKKAFGWSLDEWLFFGGYPGAARLATNEKQWRSYIVDSLVETAVTRDVLQMQKITKPTLIRHLFAFSALYPAQIFSYNKMLGQLQDAGNTTTLAHYLTLLHSAFLVTGLEQYSYGSKRKRGSSPKLLLWNNALVNALSGKTFAEAESDRVWWGRLVENAVGAHLLNHLQDLRYTISYWRDRSHEVDFVVQAGRSVWAIEVKSGRPTKPEGLMAFKRKYPSAMPLIIGRGGIPLEEFLSEHPERWLR